MSSDTLGARYEKCRWPAAFHGCNIVFACVAERAVAVFALFAGDAAGDQWQMAVFTGSSRRRSGEPRRHARAPGPGTAVFTSWENWLWLHARGLHDMCHQSAAYS
jgi:hypothetical protein